MLAFVLILGMERDGYDVMETGKGRGWSNKLVQNKETRLSKFFIER